MMKKLSIITIICILAGGLVFAQEAEIPTVDLAPFLPISPRVMAQGGAFISVAEGYEALFYNPAGFANTKFDLTITSLSTWVYMNPASIAEFVDSLPEEGEGEPDMEEIGPLLTLINEQVSTGGIGLGLSTGLGLVTNGLGLGLALVVDSYLEGKGGMADASGDIVATLGGVAGYALDMDIGGMALKVGADLRPMYRVHSVVENRDVLEIVSGMTSGNTDAAMEIITNTRALTGFGLGIDLGAMLAIGPLEVALSMRDLFGTPFTYYENTVTGIIDALEATGEIPQEEANLVTDAKYRIPMDISAGVAFNIDFLKPLLDITVHGDLQDVIGVIKYGRTPWTLLHIGAEAKVLKFASVRAGFNQGYITMGAGLHLLFLDLNAAFFTRELGQHIGDQPNSGATLEVAFRL